MKRKISVTTGTRAEYGLIRPVLKKILKNRKLDMEKSIQSIEMIISLNY